MNIYIKVFFVCFTISLLLSISFWFFWGIFQLLGFIIWSLIPALLGLLTFYATRLKKTFVSWSIAITACIVLRIAIFAYALYS